MNAEQGPTNQDVMTAGELNALRQADEFADAAADEAEYAAGEDV
ncbi:hypothetical protein [Streptomyces sp. NPDC059949]